MIQSQPFSGPILNRLKKNQQLSKFNDIEHLYHDTFSAILPSSRLEFMPIFISHP